MWGYEAFCPTSRFVTMDRNAARKPPLVILQTVEYPKSETLSHQLKFTSKIFMKRLKIMTFELSSNAANTYFELRSGFIIE
jgi:hypothetical protein